MPIIPTVWVLLACVLQTQDVYDIEISCLSESIPEQYREKGKKRAFTKIQVKGCVLRKDAGGSYFLRGKMADKTDVYVYWKSRNYPKVSKSMEFDEVYSWELTERERQRFKTFSNYTHPLEVTWDVVMDKSHYLTKTSV